MKITTFISVNNANLGTIAPKSALFTKGSKLPLNKGFRSMFELYYSLALNPQYILYSKTDHGSG